MVHSSLKNFQRLGRTHLPEVERAARVSEGLPAPSENSGDEESKEPLCLLLREIGKAETAPRAPCEKPDFVGV
jgi:hypothetical protein